MRRDGENLRSSGRGGYQRKVVDKFEKKFSGGEEDPFGDQRAMVRQQSG